MGKLELHRASAGSGKTYMLTKKYLWYFLTIVGEDGVRRLRTPAEVDDSLKHILAVTFTNKATEEMKMRIVEKLDALANLPTPLSSDNFPDYLEEFCSALNVSYQELSDVARRGMTALLGRYTDFQVSTIDSFFQLVLRNFAYEANINNSYGLELDADFITQMGVDATFESVSDRTQSVASEEVVYWLQSMMDENQRDGKKWNIFARKDDASKYAALVKAVKHLEKEDYKEKRDEIEAYFDRNPNLSIVYKVLSDIYETKPKLLYREMQSMARQLLAEVKKVDPSLKGVSDLKSHASKILLHSELKPKKSGKYEYGFSPKKTDFLIDPKGKRRFTSEVESLYSEYYFPMIYRAERWMEALTDRSFMTWRRYVENFPWLGLFKSVLQNRTNYLNELNLIELGETNSILLKIIGSDDTPFIYEKIGTRLNHYLIDEFQDTSQMQWQLFLPLLKESLSTGNENLLIGDPKQSIYRFRNADYSLISTRVEQDLTEAGFEVDIHGNNAIENTNYRSDRNIVEFNNSFFRYLIDRLAAQIKADREESGEAVFVDFNGVYSNVEQLPKKEAFSGYVEIVELEKSKGEDSESGDDEAEETQNSEWDLQIIGWIENALQRGYRLNELAILVNKRSEALQVVELIERYNNEVEDPSRRITYLTEDSLRLDHSVAVRMILMMLESIAQGRDLEIRSGEERQKRGVATWNKIRSEFMVYAMRHPQNDDMAGLLDDFIANGPNLNELDSLLSEMQVVTLPALVEAIAGHILDPIVRDQDAPYIAALLDSVLEYSANNPCDISSFLRWWSKKGEKLTIASPEGVEALKIMTVHKSKGLEFPIVILPFGLGNLPETDSKQGVEWRWVKPAIDLPEGLSLPPYLPVTVDKELKGTAHEQLYYEVMDKRTMDTLNKVYVALTRPRNELYIAFASVKQKSNLFGAWLKSWKEEQGVKDNRLRVIDENKFIFGDQYQNVPSRRTNETFSKDAKIITEYPANATPKPLLYREENQLEDGSARERGKFLHAVMEQLFKVEDLPRILRRMQIKGVISEKLEVELNHFLKECLSEEQVRCWFDGTYRVLNERSLFSKRKHLSRPDRILISPEGDLIVIDYKFGEKTEVAKYRRQVAEYMRLLKGMNKFRSVRGYLWYVIEGIVEEVCI